MTKRAENGRLYGPSRATVLRMVQISTAVLTLVGGATSASVQGSGREAAAGASLPVADNEDGSAVTNWNATALQFLAPATFAATRILAMTHLAIYDAVMAITHDHEPYAVAVDAPDDTSAGAAVAAAAHRVLVTQVPTQSAGFDSAYDAALAGIPDGTAKTNGIALGEFVAARMLFLRSGDILGPAAYSQPEAPGIWQPAGDGYSTGVVATTWPSLTPFALRSTSQFRAPKPPALTSREYALNFEATKSLGARFSATRTPEQTAAALFWAENGQIHFNALARDLAVSRGFTLSRAARLYALLNAALADGSMTAFDSKYAYDFWRPIAAIRGAATDGNAATEPDPTWDSLVPLTAAHPGTPRSTRSSRAPRRPSWRRSSGIEPRSRCLLVRERPTEWGHGPTTASRRPRRRTRRHACGSVTTSPSRQRTG